MNISGSDVSKEAANMILLGNTCHSYYWNIHQQWFTDDNFASTVST